MNVITVEGFIKHEYRNVSDTAKINKLFVFEWEYLSKHVLDSILDRSNQVYEASGHEEEECVITGTV